MKRGLIKLIDGFLYFILVNKIFITIFAFKRNFVDDKIQKIKGLVIKRSIRKQGKDLRIHGPITITGENQLSIGDYVRIGRGCYFHCVGGLTIGNNVQFSRNITIYTSTHDIESGAIPYDKNYVYKPVSIGNSVWVGMNVTIAPGTIIEDGAVIGMGTTVAGHIPKGAIVVGAKSRIIGYRDIEAFDLKDIQKKYFGLLYPDN